MRLTYAGNRYEGCDKLGNDRGLTVNYNVSVARPGAYIPQHAFFIGPVMLMLA